MFCSHILCRPDKTLWGTHLPGASDLMRDGTMLADSPCEQLHRWNLHLGPPSLNFVSLKASSFRRQLQLKEFGWCLKNCDRALTIFQNWDINRIIKISVFSFCLLGTIHDIHRPFQWWICILIYVGFQIVSTLLIQYRTQMMILQRCRSEIHRRAR